MDLEARFQKLRWGWVGGGWLTIRGAEFSEGQEDLNSQRGARFLRATMFFCKCVISVATLLLIIHITMYILIFLISRILDTK